MAKNLRKQINKELEFSIESENDWGLPVVLIDPDGITHNIKKGTTTRLSGQVLYNRVEFNPDTGEEMVIPDPIVTLRMASLDRVPANGEKWIVKIPIEPDPEAALIDYAISPSKAMEFNRSFGFVRIYLSKVVQS